MPLVQRGARFCAGCRKPIPRSQQEIAHLQNLVPDQCSGGHGTGLTRHLATPGVPGVHYLLQMSRTQVPGLGKGFAFDLFVHFGISISCAPAEHTVKQRQPPDRVQRKTVVPVG